jgi:uncharacterized protein (DUF4415 family)
VWHEAKNEATLSARGFDFAFAAGAFLDPKCLVESARKVHREDRFSAIGQTKGVLLFVVFTVSPMKTKRSIESSQQEKLTQKSVADIRRFLKSPRAKAMARRLRASGPDPSPADLEEIPTLSDEELAALRPSKVSVTVRLDGDIVEWLKAGTDRGYQTRMNAILRAVMNRSRVA